MRLSVMILLAFVLAGCGKKAPEPVSYSQQIQPILNSRCISCHGTEKAEGKILLTSYETLMSSRIPHGKKPLVIPGDYKTSWLYISCATDQPQYHMPPDTAQPTLLSKEEILLISDWIKQGANNN
ncbi:MAG TPA: c-type cytochrome domain-containing protein [Bacteroidota bacterium]|nr:c-type cytochrome domain-containing protein [Bacteroidota bacterium]